MKKSKILLFLSAVLLLTGCSLARAEAAASTPMGDRLVGFYLVYAADAARDDFYSNPNLEEYGSMEAETEQFGTVSFPQEVLFAAEDAAGNYIFPGLENGYSLFLLELEEEHGHVSRMVCNMAPGETANNITVTDEGTTSTISGTVYFGPPLGAEDWDPYETHGIWHCYRVYQTPDDRVYMDGGGNSFGGGGGFGWSESLTETYTVNGEASTSGLTVSVKVETVPRMEKLVVTQFDSSSAIIRSDDLALSGELPEITPDPAAAWVLVEEIGPESTVRTVYNVPAAGEDPISHQIILLDDDGLGQIAYLGIQ